MSGSPEARNKFKIIVVGNATTGKSSLLVRYIEGVFQADLASTIGVDFKYKDLKIQALEEGFNFPQLAKKYALKSNLSKEKFVKSLSPKRQELFNKLTSESNVHLQLWDTAGQEIYRTVTRAYYKGSNAALIIFDITNRDSFDQILSWAKEIDSVLSEQIFCSDNLKGRVNIYLVGNKIDLKEERKVTVEEAQALAVQLHQSKYKGKENETEIKGSYKDMPIKNYFEISAKSGEGVEELFNEITRNLLIGEVMQEVPQNEQEACTIEPNKDKKQGSPGFCGCGGDESEESSEEESDYSEDEGTEESESNKEEKEDSKS